MPYPFSHFYFDIKFGDRFNSKENRPGSSLFNIICCQIWYQSKSDYMDRAWKTTTTLISKRFLVKYENRDFSKVIMERFNKNIDGSDFKILDFCPNVHSFHQFKLKNTTLFLHLLFVHMYNLLKFRPQCAGEAAGKTFTHKWMLIAWQSCFPVKMTIYGPV